MIRAAVPDDITAMQRIEVAAGMQFADVGLAEIAGDEPPPAAALQAHIGDGTAWVAEVDGEPVGYVVASVVDGEGHVDQVSVVPACRGMRVGQTLIGAAADWARERDLPALTLTTFVDVPWNGPYYARLGFVPVPLAEMGPQLERIRRAEIERGLDAMQPRIAMRRELDPADARDPGQASTG